MRAALHELRIKNSDPLYEHLKPAPAPEAPSLLPSSSSTSIARVPQGLPAKPSQEVINTSTVERSAKNGAATTVREKTKKVDPSAKSKTSDEPIRVKDESMHASRMSRDPVRAKNEGQAAVSSRVREEGEVESTAGARLAAAKRYPGSGHKRQSPSEGTASPLPPSALPTQRRAELGNAKTSKRESPAPGGRSTGLTAPSKDYRLDDAPSKGREETKVARRDPIAKRKDYARASDREYDETDRDDRLARAKKEDRHARGPERDGPRGKSEKERAREARDAKAEEGEIEEKPVKVAGVLKRKTARREDESEREDGVGKKRRKLADDEVPRLRKEDGRQVGVSAKKAVPEDRTRERRERSPPRVKTKREDSPVPRVKAKREDSPPPRTKAKREETPLSRAKARQNDSPPPRSRAVKEELPPRVKARRDDSPPRTKARREDSPSHRKAKREESPPRTKVKREESPPRVRVKREESPFQRDVRAIKDVSPAPSSSSGSKSTAASRNRRERHIYTSSEDEGQIPEPRTRTKARAKPEPPYPQPPPSSSSSLSPPGSDRPRPPLANLPPGTDCAGIRAKYQRRHPKYLAAYYRVRAEQQTVEELLDARSDATDSDGDVEMLDEQTLVKAVEEFRALEAELVGLRREYFQRTGMNAEAE
jgi:hypothetical protein